MAARRADAARAGQRGQGLRRRVTAPSCSRTACSSTAASALTFEHDLHLYLRRQTVNRALYGTPDRAPAAHRRPRRPAGGRRVSTDETEDLERLPAAGARVAPRAPRAARAGRHVRPAPQRPHRRGGARRGRARPRGSSACSSTPASPASASPREYGGQGLTPAHQTGPRTRSSPGYEYPIRIQVADVHALHGGAARLRHRGAEASTTSRRSSRARSCGCSSSPSRAAAPTWPAR